MVSTTDRIDGRPGDAALVTRILDDPSRGWSDAWDRYGHALHSFCLRMLDDPAEADDAVADVFLVAAQRIGQLERPEAFRAWLYAIARRRVQRRWRERARTAPVDPHGDVVMNASTTEIEPAGADDAAELLAAASAGLSDRDRELLALTLGADLDTTEVARITGESTNAVSVRVTRLKETVARAAGALLVARHHRRACEVLDGILADWDGTFDTVWRKRIARHIDACDECTRRRGAATAVFAAPMLLAPPSSALRDRVLAPISAVRAGAAPDLGPYDDEGFPSDARGGRRPAWWLTAAGIVAVVLTAGGLLWAAGRDPAPDQALATSPADDTTAATVSTTTSAPPASSETTEPQDLAAPPTTAANAPPTSGSNVVVPTPTPTSPPPTTSPPTTLPAPPTVVLRVAPTRVQATCGSGDSVTVSFDVTAGAAPASSRISWDGPNPGAATRTGTGAMSMTIGPFDAADTVTVTAVTTDGLGRASAPATGTVVVDPCPG